MHTSATAEGLSPCHLLWWFICLDYVAVQNCNETQSIFLQIHFYSLSLIAQHDEPMCLVMSRENSCRLFYDVVCLPSDSRIWSFAVSFTDSRYHFFFYLYSQNLHKSCPLSRDDKNTKTISFAETPDFTSVSHPVAGKQLPFWLLVSLFCSPLTVQVWLLQQILRGVLWVKLPLFNPFYGDFHMQYLHCSHMYFMAVFTISNGAKHHCSQNIAPLHFINCGQVFKSGCLKWNS